MSQTELAVNFFVTLLALIDPIGNVPVFAAGTAGASAAGRRRVAFYISLFVLGFLTFFLFTGIGLLQFFGISLPAFRIAGGVILFLLGLKMVDGELSAGVPETGEPQASGRAYVRRRFEGMIVPFAMPLLIGPGANAQEQQLAKLLAAVPTLKPQLASATWVGGRRWDLNFSSGETVALPEGYTAALTAIDKFAKLDKTSGLLGRGIVRFDLRVPDKMIVRLPRSPGEPIAPPPPKVES
jgi:MarC family membrane protein